MNCGEWGRAVTTPRPSVRNPPRKYTTPSHLACRTGVLSASDMEHMFNRAPVPAYQVGHRVTGRQAADSRSPGATRRAEGVTNRQGTPGARGAAAVTCVLPGPSPYRPCAPPAPPALATPPPPPAAGPVVAHAGAGLRRGRGRGGAHQGGLPHALARLRAAGGSGPRGRWATCMGGRTQPTRLLWDGRGVPTKEGLLPHAAARLCAAGGRGLGRVASAFVGAAGNRSQGAGRTRNPKR